MNRTFCYKREQVLGPVRKGANSPFEYLLLFYLKLLRAQRKYCYLRVMELRWHWSRI
jgi:hypothetical protein